MQYILSRKQDLLYFLLSPLLSVSLVLIFFVATRVFYANPLQTKDLIYFWFYLLFDKPHVLQTFSRTHFDGAERTRHRLFHFALLPVMMLAPFFFYPLFNNEVFYFLFAAFGVWHIYAQNLGFLKLYARMNRTPPSVLLPEMTFYRGIVCLYAVRAANSYQMFDFFGYGLGLERLLYLGIAISGLWMIVQQRRSSEDRPFLGNTRKQFLLAIVAVTSMNAWLAAYIPLLVLEALATIYHDVQYLGWMAHYQQKTFPQRGVALKWLAGCLVISGILAAADSYAPVLPVLIPVGMSFYLVTIYHYFIDGLIWKFSKQPELRPLLGSTPILASQKAA